MLGRVRYNKVNESAGAPSLRPPFCLHGLTASPSAMGSTGLYVTASGFWDLVNGFDVSQRSDRLLLTAHTLRKTAISWTSITCEVSFGKVQASTTGTIVSLVLLRSISVSCLSGDGEKFRKVEGGDFNQI